MAEQVKGMPVDKPRQAVEPVAAETEAVADNPLKRSSAATAQSSTTAAPAQLDREYRGVEGWLAFFMVMFGLGGFCNVIAFFVLVAALAGGDSSVSNAVGSVTSLAAGVVMIIAAVNIAMRKRLGRTMSYAALVTMAVASVIDNITVIIEQIGSSSSSYVDYYYSYSRVNSAPTVIMMIGATVVQLGLYALVIYYFKKSRRVQATLIN